MSLNGMHPGTSKTCSNGHYYYGDNVIPTKDGRRCRACLEAGTARQKAKREAERAAVREPAPDTRWRDQAGCTEAEPTLFDSLSKRESTECDSKPRELGRIRAGLSYCDACPVRARCLEWAKATGQQGVWGGEYLSREGRSKKGAAA